MKPINIEIANYMAEEVPPSMWPEVLYVLESYQNCKDHPVSFTGTQELADHLTAIGNIIDANGARHVRWN